MIDHIESEQDRLITVNSKKKIGRPRGARDKGPRILKDGRRPYTQTMSVRGEPETLRSIRVLVTRARLGSPSGMLMSDADILEQAMQEYAAARSDTRSQRRSA